MRSIATAAFVAFAAAAALDEREQKMQFKFHADGTTTGESAGLDLKTSYHRHQDTFTAMQGSSNTKVEYKGSTTTANPRVAKPMQSSRCVDYDGETDALCAQNFVSPTCPMTFVAAWYRCVMLGQYLYNLENLETIAELTWYTSPDCVVYRTFCEVQHPTHNSQFEDETYDYRDVCDGTVSIQYTYSNQLHYENSSSSAISVGNFRLPLGEQESVFSFYDEGRLIREELLTVAVYERDTNGYVRVATGDVELARSGRRAPQGLWSQFNFVVNTYDAFENKFTEVLAPWHYHITKIMTLSACPVVEQWRRYDRHDSSFNYVPVIMASIGAVVILLGITIGVHWYFTKRRAYYTARALEAQQIQVVSATVVDPSQLSRCGSIVQGVPVDVTASDKSEKSAAPLPPAASSSTPDRDASA